MGKCTICMELGKGENQTHYHATEPKNFPINIKYFTRTHLRKRHSGDDGKHYFLPLSGVGVLLVLLQPSLKGAGGLSGGVFTTRSTV